MEKVLIVSNLVPPLGGFAMREDDPRRVREGRFPSWTNRNSGFRTGGFTPWGEGTSVHSPCTEKVFSGEVVVVVNELLRVVDEECDVGDGVDAI